ncbi:MAG: PASTA domain-containing protein, partial [bacterium]|nr:PASTA domain-containing protein [bacterium]
GTVSQEYIDTIPENNIMGQSPAAGTSVRYGSPVDVTVSTGKWTGVDESAPHVAISALPETVYIDEEVTLSVNAWDNAGVVDRHLTINGDPVDLVGDEFIFSDTTAAGIYTAEVTVMDEAGFTASASTDFRVADPYDNTSPVAAFDDDDCITVTDLYSIQGEVSDEAGVSYTLQMREDGASEWITFAEGVTSSIEGELGVFDPTVLRNGIHRIRLYAEDLSGNSTIVENCAMVEGGLKVGQVILPATDLSIPRPGMPLTLEREYDSRAQGPGDFGPGWNLPSSNVKAAITTPLGEEWDQNVGGQFITTYILVEKKKHVVMIRFSDEKILKFKMDVAPKTSVLISFEGGHRPMTVGYTPVDGTQGSLAALDNDRHVMLLYGRIYDIDMKLYNPKRFRYTDVDGTVYVINTEKGIESITDVYGHAVTYSENGISHSSGISISFERDSSNRIETIKDPFGKEYDYYYGDDGILEKVIERGDGPQLFRMMANYSSCKGFMQNKIKEIKAPDGTALGSFEYDDKGRVIAMTDAEGNKMVYGFDIPNHRQTVTDKMGNETLYEHDNKGNVTHMVDDHGNEAFYSYDSRSNMLSKTNRLGHTTTYTYDENGNRLTETDPLGNPTEYTYNSDNKVLTKKDPLGNVTTNSYDDNGKLLSITKPLDTVITNTYDSHGNKLWAAKSYGDSTQTTSYEYDESGICVSATDPLGTVSSFSYDEYGRMISKTVTRTTENGPVEMVTGMKYDRRGRLFERTDPDGTVTAFEYDALGNKSADIDKAGKRTSYEYDGNGKLTRTVFPDGTETARTYDAAGNPVTSSNRSGFITNFVHDTVINQATRITVHTGAAKQMEYDATGRLSAITDENGKTTSYEYDKAGRKTRVLEGADGETVFTFDANGNTVSMTDAAENTTTYEYDALNRLIRTTFADETYTAVGYAFDRLKAWERDQAGRITRFEYDAAGRLVKVIDPNEGETVYSYDESGNKIGQTDQNGRTTSREYDNLGRVVKHTLPLEMFEAFSYDSRGSLVSRTDFNGETTSYEYDSCSRPLKKIFPDGSEVSYEYSFTATGNEKRVSYAGGTTVYRYDGLNRLVNRSNPDGSEISYTYDLKGNRTSVATASGSTTYTYDEMNRLAAVTGPDDGITTYTYNPVGTRARVTYPNGVITEYGYDRLNRITGIEARNASNEILAQYSYTLDPVGNRLQEAENNGRTVDYTYDNLYRLAEENITDPVLGNETISYTFDSFSNRLSKTDSSGTVNYTYDLNDRLTAETGPYSITYEYDKNGNTLSTSNGTETTQYGYDYENLLVSIENGTNSAAYTYDDKGIRCGAIVNGTVIKYLVDGNTQYARVLEERDGSNNLLASYTYGDSLISRHSNGNSSYYQYDIRQSTRLLTNTAGDVENRYVYDAYGRLLNQTGTAANNNLYTGEQYDPHAGLYNLRARYYNPANGRFLNRDTWSGREYEPVTLHKYLYGNANPVSYTDPSGHMSLVNQLSCVAIVATLAKTAYTGYKVGKAKNTLEWKGHIAAGTSNVGATGFMGGGLLIGLIDEPPEELNTDSWGGYVVVMVGVTAGFDSKTNKLSQGSGGTISTLTLRTPGIFADWEYLCGLSSWISITGAYGIGFSKTWMTMGQAYGNCTWLVPWVAEEWVVGFDVGVDVMLGWSIQFHPEFNI